MRAVLGTAVAVVLIALACAVAAYAFSKSQPETYEARAAFAVGRIGSPGLSILGPDFTEPDVEEDIRVATEADRLESLDYAVATARSHPELGLTPGEIAGRISAQPTRGTLVVELTATGPTPQAAARLGRAYSQVYRRELRDAERDQARDIERALEARLQSLSPGGQRGPRGAGIRDQLSAVHVLQRVDTGSPELIESARASQKPAKPLTTRNVLFGLLFGLVAGVGLVALRSDSRVRSAMTPGRGARVARGSPVAPRS
jgi:uncharacterized protein involved in exopolysaccharide biosynthesis